MSEDKELIEKISNLALYANLKDMLSWKRCIYMTFEQYAKKEHLNDKIYIYSGITNNIKDFVGNHLKELASKLPFKKVPKPIFVLFAKKLEYDSTDSILSTTCKNAYEDLKSGKLRYDEFREKYNKNKGMTLYRQYEKVYDIKEEKYVDDYNDYRDYDVSCFLDNENNVIDKYSADIDKRIFIYDKLKNESDIEGLKKSSLASYKFKGNYEVIIYVPNLTNDMKYFTSFYEFSNQNRWMSLISNNLSKFLNIIPFKKDYEESIVKMVGKEAYDKNAKFKEIVRNLNYNDEMEYPFMKDMSYVCFNMGCTSEYGEDLEEIVPTVATTYDDQVSNASAKGPYFPTKCLKTDYYHKHMMNFKTGESMIEYKKKLQEQLMKDVDVFKKNYEKVQAGQAPTDGYSSDNIVDVLKGSAARFRNQTYKEGKGDKEYSKEYNRKILAELAYRHNAYPGVQEIVFPCFVLNDTFVDLQEYTHLMPWGNILLLQQYVLSEGDVLKLDETVLTSFNKLWEMKYDVNNKLSLFKEGIKIKTIIDFEMKAYTQRSMVFENGSLNLYGYDENGNNDNRFSLFVSKADSISPLSIVIENDGKINVYQNGFNVIKTL